MRPERSILSAPALLTTVGLAAAGILSACAGPPVRNYQLEQARIAVHNLEQDPDAQNIASQQLSDARANLQRAEYAFHDRRPTEEVTHFAYLADLQTAIGHALAGELRARRELANANEQRTQIQLQARTEEVRRAREQAQRAQSELAELKARQTERGTELTLASDVLFNTGAAELKPGAILQINRFADYMRSNPKTRIIVEGNTDNTGSAAFNEQLSVQRAQAVASTLEMQGIATDRIQTVGRGENFPVANNATVDGRQQNRRVDIVLSDASGSFAPVVR